jgi:solute carrier family 6 amino acid transporter-like protein 5/7/9/14
MMSQNFHTNPQQIDTQIHFPMQFTSNVDFMLKLILFISIVVLLLVGKPLYYMELLLGQFSSSGTVKVYDLAPAMRGIGIGQVLSTCFVTTYYASLMGLTIRYFLASFGDPLPWSMCKEEWNVSCIDSSLKALNFSGEGPKSSAELYFL